MGRAVQATMRRSALALLLIGLVACGQAGAGDGASTDSGIRGRAVVGPMCPVEVAGTPCPDRPLQTKFEVVDTSGKGVATVSTGKDGRFQQSLPPGTYVLRSASSTSPFPSPKETMVRVRAGEFTSVVVHFDSGIR
jgi:hypothetical protein